MKARLLFSALWLIVCLVSLWMVYAQHQQLGKLREEHQRLLADANAPAAVPAPEHTVTAQPTPPVELLELRSKVTTLMRRERELNGVRAENAQLHAKLAAKATNTPAPPALPEGYILRSKVRFRGYATPDATVESFFWALQTRNTANYLQTLTPKAAQEFQKSAQTSSGFVEDLLQNADYIPGLRIIDSDIRRDGTAEVKIECIPGLDPWQMPLRQINGQWKIDQSLPR